MICYEGPSMLDGKPIIGVITGLVVKSRNTKTGPMAQLWILPQAEIPTEAIKSGEDESVCGDCPARGNWCYVNLGQAPNNIWRTWKRGGYQQYDLDLLADKVLRFGAYGDPAAIPISRLEQIGRRVRRFTGYTHQWRSCDREFQHYCMASVDTLSDQKEATRLGWRTFRVTAPDSPKQRGESVCPASEEAGHKITCFDCGACDGRRRPKVKSHIVINAHGSKTKRYLVEYA